MYDNNILNVQYLSDRNSDTVAQMNINLEKAESFNDIIDIIKESAKKMKKYILWITTYVLYVVKNMSVRFL